MLDGVDTAGAPDDSKAVDKVEARSVGSGGGGALALALALDLSPNRIATRRSSPFLLSTGQALNSYPWTTMGQVQNPDCADPFEARPSPILPFI